jgi:acyl-CoA synthetase (AMP-forming)/AMP-acid ligase II
MSALRASFDGPGWTTLVDLLEHRGRCQGEDTAFTFLENGNAEAARVTFGDLAGRARRVGAELQRRGAAGERVLLVYPSGLDFIAAFFGCLYAGAAAVPAPAGMSRSRARLEAIVADAGAALVLTPGGLVNTVRRRLEASPHLAVVGTDDAIAGSDAGWTPPEIDGGSLALLQYTSGSTGVAKGVMVTHANILHNEELIRVQFEHTPESVMVSWLPMFHDMGLIGMILQPLYVGFPCVLMSPESFLQEPRRWLRAITRYRGTTSGAPNFAYDTCVDRIPDAERADLDLTSWRVAYNGSEPIRAATLERFVEAFAPCGFRRETFYPCYGLAEATLLTTGSRPSEPPVVRALGEGTARAAVGCGRSGGGQELLIVDPASGRPVPDGEVGEVWLAGPSVARGYWGRAEESRETFGARLVDGRGPFLRTGDLGVLVGGELFVTGRLKEVMIVRGRNHYPQDIERTAEESHPALSPHGGAAFMLDGGGQERLAVAHEVRRQYGEDPPTGEIARRVREAVSREHGLHVAVLVLLKAGGIPRTSSGKIQRRTCQARYLGGTLGVIGEDRHGSPGAPP